jgi:ABC-type phosphate/phosphonate transport system substrate-binding protein
MTAPKPYPARDWLERLALNRTLDLKIVDRFVDKRTEPPPFSRQPVAASRPADARMAANLPLPDDTNPFPERVPLPPEEPTVRVVASVSTYHTRTRQEVLSSLAPLFDLIQRDVDIRAAAVLADKPEDVYYGLLDGKEQMAITNAFEYLLVRSWFANVRDNGVVLLAWAQPANPAADPPGAELAGPPGTSIVLVVAADAKYQKFGDLKGTRLALAANYVDAPGTFLTGLLADAGQPVDQSFFGSVTLRRYTKDALIDVLKGKADVACVDVGTLETLKRFYGIGGQVRVLTRSPRYNIDVLYTSLNNIATHPTEIEMTQRQLETLGKDQEGQEVLFLFDTQEWHNYREGEIDTVIQNFNTFLSFLDHTPVDLKPLLDPHARVEAHTYDRYGDE